MAYETIADRVRELFAPMAEQARAALVDLPGARAVSRLSKEGGPLPVERLEPRRLFASGLFAPPQV